MNSRVPFIRQPVIDTIARNVLNAYDYHILMGAPKAIPIERIIESAGLTIDYQYLRKNDRILGETVFEDAEIPVYDMQDGRYTTIFVNAGTILADAHLLESGNEGRLRFTYAHEYGHWVLHKSLFVGSEYLAAMVNGNENYVLSSEAGRSIECQADLLAAAIIMPITQIKRACYALRCRGVNDGMLVAQMAALFEVSNQAMRIRLKGHNLI